MDLIWFNLPIIAPNISVTFGYFIRDWNINHSDWREEKILALQSHSESPLSTSDSPPGQLRETLRSYRSQIDRQWLL